MLLLENYHKFSPFLSNYIFNISFRFTKRSHHSYEANTLGQIRKNGSDKESCFGDLHQLHKTWLSITNKIENIQQHINSIKKGLVTISLQTKLNARFNNIQKELSGLSDAVIEQQKLTSYEYPLGDILKPVKKNTLLLPFPKGYCVRLVACHIYS